LTVEAKTKHQRPDWPAARRVANAQLFCSLLEKLCIEWPGGLRETWNLRNPMSPSRVATWIKQVVPSWSSSNKPLQSQTLWKLSKSDFVSA